MSESKVVKPECGPRQSLVRVARKTKPGAMEFYYIARQVIHQEHIPNYGVWGRIRYKGRSIQVTWDAQNAEWYVPWAHEVMRAGRVTKTFRVPRP
jgi:hypothetical protein